MKTLTISIAAYNVETFIEQTLESLIDPTVLDELEILIVNDGSTDNTVEIVSKYVEKYPNTFQIIDKANGGYGSTINSSLRIASGKFYKLLDGDDWYNTKNLKKFIDYLKNSEADLIITPVIEIISETKEETIVNPLCDMIEGQSFTFNEYPKGKRISMHQACFKTNVIQNNNIEIREHCFYTDTEYLLKCMSKCKTIECMHSPIYMYRIGLDEQSMSLEGIRKHYKDAVKYFKEMIRYQNEENIDNSFQKNYLDDAMVSLARYHLTMFLLLPTSKKVEYEQFEEYIKTNAKDIYEKSNCRTLNLLRKTNNLLYKPICIYTRIRAKGKIRV